MPFGAKGRAELPISIVAIALPTPARAEIQRPTRLRFLRAHDKRTVLFNSGAEAVENAVKIARHATGRAGVVVVDHAYHGRTNLTLALTAKSMPYKSGFGPFAAGIHPLDVDTKDMSSPAVPEMLAANGARVLDADVERERAEAIVSGVLLEAVNPLHVMYDKYEPKIERATFCLYPIYFARYEYNGEARRTPHEAMFVAISAVTGKVVAARYPSAARSVAAKVRRLLSFDRRM